MTTIYTIGYEKANINDFLAILEMVNIEVLLDVRLKPISRKKGFSKAALQESLLQAGIRYIHLPALGNPDAGQQAARSGDYHAFHSIFEEHMTTQKAVEALDFAVDTANTHAACLLCLERNPQQCHRSLVAAAMKGKADMKIWHLGVQDCRSRQGPPRNDFSNETIYT